MSLKSDLDDAKEIWKDSSFATRCLIVLSLVLATSSITSLADVVFKWKGFILQGVDFYQVWIKNPLADLFAWARLPELAADFFLACSLFVTIYLKCESGDRPNWSLRKHLVIALGWTLVGTGTMIFMLFLYPSSFSFSFVVICSLMCGALIDVSRRERLAYFVLLGIVFLVLLVLAAINSGLTAPL